MCVCGRALVRSLWQVLSVGILCRTIALNDTRCVVFLPQSARPKLISPVIWLEHGFPTPQPSLLTQQPISASALSPPSRSAATPGRRDRCGPPDKPREQLGHSCATQSSPAFSPPTCPARRDLSTCTIALLSSLTGGSNRKRAVHFLANFRLMEQLAEQAPGPRGIASPPIVPAHCAVGAHHGARRRCHGHDYMDIDGYLMRAVV